MGKKQEIMRLRGLFFSQYQQYWDKAKVCKPKKKAYCLALATKMYSLTIKYTHELYGKEYPNFRIAYWAVRNMISNVNKEAEKHGFTLNARTRGKLSYAVKVMDAVKAAGTNK